MNKLLPRTVILSALAGAAMLVAAPSFAQDFGPDGRDLQMEQMQRQAEVMNAIKARGGTPQLDSRGTPPGMPGYLGPNIDRVDRDRVNRDRVERERIERERVERVNRGSRFGGYDSRRAENEARRPDYNWRERDYNVRRPEFRQGDRIPEQFRSRQYVVNNWQSHGLQQPPRGHEWVQVGADYALVAIGSGVIAALVLTN